MKLLLFGHQGQLGSYLSTSLQSLGEIARYDQAECDLMDLARVRAVIRTERPQVIVNASAYTAVDQAEQEEATARRLNAEAPGVMAEAARELGALLVHYSTDYVFDGSATIPYMESSPTAPLGAYGRTKLAGEQAVAAAGDRHVILRTAWLYSNRGRNFLRTMLRLAEERDELRVVDDQVGCPTYAALVALATARIIERLHAPDAAHPYGLYHLACRGSTSWCNFARRIVQLAGRAQAVRVTPIPTRDYPTPAQRPAYSVLECSKLAQDYGISLPSWESGLEQCFADRRAGH
jgi:dTDP-4-dehydrorhamnose reductase